MACCKCCCGNKDCAEGEQGKCCCGGSSGTCCQPGEYCCSGVCQEGPCVGACCNGTVCTQTTEAECAHAWQAGVSCDPNPCQCPSGCPSVASCYLIVVLDYISIGGTDNIESINALADDYKDSAYNTTCQLAFYIADIGSEAGGDITGLLTIDYDAYCHPRIASSSIAYSQDCENDPNVTCVPVIVTLDCNTFP